MTGHGGGPDPSPLFPDDGDDEEDETIGPGERRVAPDGKYRVLGVDPWPFPPEDWVEGDYDTKEEALAVAREKNKKSAGGEVLEPGHEKLGMISRYYAYDDDGDYIGGDIHAGE